LFYLPAAVNALAAALESAIALNAGFTWARDDIVTILIDKSKWGKVF